MFSVVQERRESIGNVNAGEYLAEAIPDQAKRMCLWFLHNQDSKLRFWLYLATKLVFHKLLLLLPLPLLPSLMAFS